MNYLIRKLVLGNSYKKAIKISEAEFNDIWLAKETLVQVNEIEEYFDCLVENYYEIERDLLDLALRYSMFRNLDYVSFSVERTRMNRRLANFLSSARGFLDRLEGFSKDKNHKGLLQKPIKEARAKAYDGSISYRLMEGLRNHVQHFGHGIHTFSYNSKWVETDFGEAIQNNSILLLDVHTIEEAKIVKPKVAKDLKENGQIIDLRPHIRKYISLVGEVHFQFRDLFKPTLEKSDSIVTNWIDEYLGNFPEEKSAAGVNAVKQENETKTVFSVPLFKNLIEIRKHYERKNSLLKNVFKHFVSSEITKEKF